MLIQSSDSLPCGYGQPALHSLLPRFVDNAFKQPFHFHCKLSFLPLSRSPAWLSGWHVRDETVLTLQRLLHTFENQANKREM